MTPRLTVPSEVTLGGTVESHGTLAGEGLVGNLDVAGVPWVLPPLSIMLPCHVSPGDAEYKVGTLSAAGSLSIGGGTTLDVDVSDDGSGLRYDQLAAASVHVTADPSASPAGRVTVALRSSNGTEPASVDNFDPTQPYQWPIVTAWSSPTVDHPECFTVDASQFNGGSATGTFSVEQPEFESSLYVVYTPGPCSAGPARATARTGPTPPTGAPSECRRTATACDSTAGPWPRRTTTSPASRWRTSCSTTAASACAARP